MMSDIVEKIVNEQYDLYDKAREEYRKVIREQAAEIERLREYRLKYQDAAESAMLANSEIERLREALKHNQRPEGETLDGVIAWIKSDSQRLDMTLFKLQQKDSE